MENKEIDQNDNSTGVEVKATETGSQTVVPERPGIITDEIKETVKKTNLGKELFIGSVSFNDGYQKWHEFEMILEKPMCMHAEGYQKAAAQTKKPITAALNLIVSLAVYPDGATVRTALEDYPNVILNFTEEQIIPFFGDQVETRMKKL